MSDEEEEWPAQSQTYLSLSSPSIYFVKLFADNAQNHDRFFLD